MTPFRFFGLFQQLTFLNDKQNDVNKRSKDYESRKERKRETKNTISSVFTLLVLRNHTISDISSSRFTLSDDFDDLTALESKIARNRIVRGDARQFGLRHFAVLATVRG